MGPRKRRKVCADCGKRTTELSKKGICIDCSIRRQMENVRALQRKEGYEYEKWKMGMKLWVEKL